jgi:hypothetical protein
MTGRNKVHIITAVVLSSVYNTAPTKTTIKLK